jgi:hypothetical protein
MRNLILSSAAVAAAAVFMAFTAAPASAQSGGTPSFCYEHPDFFTIACQGKTVVYNIKTGYPAPQAPTRGHHCSYNPSRGAPAPAVSTAATSTGAAAE